MTISLMPQSRLNTASSQYKKYLKDEINRTKQISAFYTNKYSVYSRQKAKQNR
jgi:hypothetical protein